MVKLSIVAICMAIAPTFSDAQAAGSVEATLLVSGGGVTLSEDPVSDGQQVRMPALRIEGQLIDRGGTPFYLLFGVTGARRNWETNGDKFVTRVTYVDAALGVSLSLLSSVFVRLGAGGSILCSPSTTPRHERPVYHQMRSQLGPLVTASVGMKPIARFGLELAIRYRSFQQEELYGDYFEDYSLGGTETTLGVAYQLAGPR